MSSESSKNVLGILSAFQVILERYPKLMAGDYYGGKDTSLTTISFMLDILKIFGVDNDFLYKWLSNLLLDEAGGTTEKGILIAIEESIKAILLTYLTGLYTCPVDPVLPDYFLKTPYPDQGADLEYPSGTGITIPLSRIDAFGLLQNCPVSDLGSVFYFDTVESGYTQSSVYKSNDFNAFLWYVVNKSSSDGTIRSVWDNRVHYAFEFKMPEDGKSKKDAFVAANCQRSPSRVVTGIGVKKQIIQCGFQESAISHSGTEDYPSLSVIDLKQANSLRVWGVSDRYYHQGLQLADGTLPGGRLNKTIFQFNADYIYSLKLFDSKTVVAQVINALLGLSSSFSTNFSLQMNITIKKIEKLVEKVITMESVTAASDSVEDGYFEFSDDEYDEIVNDATLRYSGKYQTGNDVGALEDVDKEAISKYISEISIAGTPEEKEQVIINALKNVGDSLSSSIEIDASSSFPFNKSLIYKFIKELVVQIAMQVLSPKVMLIFAINSKFLGDDGITDAAHWEAFFKDFWNVLRSCIRKISELIMQELLDLVIGQLKPIVSLIVKKLLLETVYYYRILLEELVTNCLPKFSTNTSNMIIDNVNYADIIPEQTTPPKP